MDKVKKCCFCKKEIKGYGNNAEPLKKGYCCDECNIKLVIPTRFKATITKEQNNK